MSETGASLIGRARRVRTPSVLQFEAAECGAASLAMVLGHYGRHVPLETLRTACGVSRDGSKASNILKAARSYGLEAKGLRAEPFHLEEVPLPAIAFVDFCHFLVVDGYDRHGVYLNDPAAGRRKVTWPDFDAMFTGVVLTFRATDTLEKSDERPALWRALLARTQGLRGAMALILFISLALVIPGLILPVLSRVFVDQVLVRGLDDWLVPLLLGMLGTAAVRYLLALAQSWYLAQAETYLAIQMTRDLFSHILRLPIPYFGSRYSGEVGSRLNLSSGLARLLTGDVTRTVLNIVTATFFVLLMLAYDGIITLVVVVLCVANVFAVWMTSRVVSEAYRKISIEKGKVNGVALAGIRDIETYKAAGAEDSFFARWAGLRAGIVTAEQEIARKQAIVGAVPPLITAWTAAAVLILGGHSVMQGDMTIGTLVAFQTLAASFVAPVVALTELGAKFQEVRSFTERTEDVLRHPQDAVFKNPPQIEDRLPDGGVQVDRASFGYLPLEPPLIEELSLKVRPAGRIALVGASGSGKSTVGRLIVGLYELAEGDVLISGQPLGHWSRSARASRLAYIDQDIVLFEGTVRDNLTLWDATIPEARVVKAAKDAMIHDEIASRPGAYDSLVEEGGQNFSGGQRQRLEIARALASNPSIIVMDEATSALDTLTERQIMENIRARNTTLIIIAHRLSTIRDCDEIIVLERGKPVERGRHDDLMAHDGKYAELIEA